MVSNHVLPYIDLLPILLQGRIDVDATKRSKLIKKLRAKTQKNIETN